MTFARSISPITPLDWSITRVAITKPEDAEFVEGEGESAGKGGKVTEMGRKPFVPYGLYRAHGFFSAPLAAKTGVSAADLALFWEALTNMWEHDRSASRGFMACRGLYVFTHDNGLGRAQAQDLFARVTVRKKDGVAAPRSIDDYEVAVNGVDLPEGVALTRLVG